MKKILLSLVALVCATVSSAQSSLLATLSHEGTISTFYGTTALKQALEKAEHGDAITLSAGQFLAANINKAITLRGAGMSISNDSINAHEATLVQGDFDLEITDSTVHRLMVEGVNFTSQITYKSIVRNPLFMKTRIGKLDTSTGSIVNGSFIHCRIAESFYLSNNSNATFINSVVMHPKNTSSSSNFEFDNCVVAFNGSYHGGNVHNSYYKNCIILDGSGVSYIPSSCVAYNCVGVAGYNNNIFSNIKNNTNTLIANPTLSSLFETVRTWDYNDSEMYEWTDESKAKYLGTDGKEVGIHGGSLPYDENPTTPQITKCNVAAKSTADGKLSVDIEVKAAE